MPYLLLLLLASFAYGQCVSVAQNPISMPPPYTLPTGEVGIDYHFQFRAANGQPPYYFYSYMNRPLPWGLTLSVGGELTGRPTSTRSNDVITIIVRDARVTEANVCEFRLTIVPNRLAITSATLPRATVGMAYSTTLTVTSAVAPYRFELLGGAYPPGIQGFANGLLNGTPTTPGTYTMRFRVTDANNNTATADVTLTVDGPSLRFETSSLPAGEVGRPYNATLRLAGNPANSTFQLISGLLPAGLTLSNAGAITGTPTTAGDFPFTIRASSAAGTAESPFSIRIAASTQPFTLQELPLSRFPAGVPVNTRFNTIGGQGPATFTLLEGTIPAGLEFTTSGTVVGTPRGLPGIYSQRWQATDSAGSRSERTVVITIEAPRTMPPGLVGQPYSHRETSPGRYSLAPGNRLPLGLTLSLNGTLAGTPLATGDHTFAVRVDADTTPTEIRAYNLNIAAQPGDLELDSIDLPPAALGTAYQQPITSRPPATSVHIFEGSLPPGIALQGNTLSGIPSIAGFHEFVLELRSGSRTVRRRYAIAVEAPGRPSLGAVTNAASYEGPAIAPGQIITLFGTNLDRLQSASIGSQNAHILYSTANQAAIIASYAIPTNSSARLTLVRDRQESMPYALRVIPALPGIFTSDGSGRGEAAALNQDASLNTAQNPAAQASIVVLYGTGLGLLEKPVLDGQPTTSASLALAFKAGELLATVEGQPATIHYAGSAPGLIAGVDQVNLQLPPNLPSGPVRLRLTVGSRATPEVRIHLQ